MPRSVKPSAIELESRKLAVDFALAFQYPGGVALEIVSGGQLAENVLGRDLLSDEVEEREAGPGVPETEAIAIQSLQKETSF